MCACVPLCERERAKAGGTVCKTHMLYERCESRAGMRELREAETELGEGTILGKTILGSMENGERRCSVTTVKPRGSFCT